MKTADVIQLPVMPEYLEAIRGEILSTVENVVDVYVTHNPKKQNKKPESVSIH
ncbi:hypothetical protein ACULNC_02355 [Shigella flexneri]